MPADDTIDPASLKQLREAVETVPAQTNARAAKSLADLKAAVKRLEGSK